MMLNEVKRMVKEQKNTSNNVFESIVIGGGPAGLTAGLYLSRYRIDVALIEKGFSGGQVNLSEIIENYPGFPEGIMGPELMQKFEEQAVKFGLKIFNESVIKVSKIIQDGAIRFIVKTDNGEFYARTIVIASGGEANKLSVPGEKELTGRGVSYCGTCDGAFFRDKEVVVVGGGDTALEESLFLTRFASKVTIIHRRDELRGSKILQERVFNNPKIDFKWSSIVESINGNNHVENVLLKNVKTGETNIFPCQGVFIFTGYKPSYPDLGEMYEQLVDDRGYIVTDENMKTKIEGVFACGDVRAKEFRQIVTACGEGATAAFYIEAFLKIS